MPVYVGPTAIAMLARMRLPHQVMVDLGVKIGGERANVAEHEPNSVVGFETWRWGTRFAREDKTLSDLSWVLCDRDQVPGIRHAELKLKLVCCGTDENTGNPSKSPKNISERGVNSCKLIAKNSGQIEMDLGDNPSDSYDQLWYYCSYYSEKFISIEISRPTSEIGGFVTAFSDRIIVAQPGAIPGIRRFTVPQEFADVPKPQVSRRQ